MASILEKLIAQAAVADTAKVQSLGGQSILEKLQAQAAGAAPTTNAPATPLSDSSTYRANTQRATAHQQSMLEYFATRKAQEEQELGKAQAKLRNALFSNGANSTDDVSTNRINPIATMAGGSSNKLAPNYVAPDDNSLSFMQRFGLAAKGAAKDYAGSSLNTYDVLTRGINSANPEVKDTIAQGKTDRIQELETKIADPNTSFFQKLIYEGQLKTLKNSATTEDVTTARDKLMTESAEDISTTKEGLGKLGTLAVDVGVGGTQLLGDIGLAAATGGSALVPMAIRSFGGGAYQAEQSGGTLGQQLLYGTLTGATAAVVERIANAGSLLSKAYGKGALDTALQNATTKAINRFVSGTAGKQVAQRLATAGIAGLGEGFEEALESTLSPLYQKITYYPDAKANAEDIIYDGLVGAIIGALAGGASPVDTTTADTKVDANAQQTAQETQNMPPDNFKQTQAPVIPPTGVTATPDATTAQNATESVTEPTAQQGGTLHINERTNKNVVSRKVNAFQFENPELHKYFIQAAATLQDDIAMSDEYSGRVTERDARTNKRKQTYKRISTDILDEAMDELNLTRPRLMKILDDIIQNHGIENYADAKRVELLLDDMLSKGYTRIDGLEMPAHGGYIAAKQAISGAPTINVRQQAKADQVRDFAIDMMMAEEGLTEEQALAEWNRMEAQRKAEAQATTQTTEQLPEGMGAASTQQEMGARSVGAAESAYPTKQKISEVYTNTFKNTDILSDEAKAALDEKDYIFDSVSEKQSKSIAEQRVDADFEGEVADLSAREAYTAAEDTDTAMTILERYAAEGETTGDYSAMASWSKDVYQKVHQSAVSLQAMDKYSRTPEGAVIKAQQAMFQAEKKATEHKVLGKTVKNNRGRQISADIDTVTKIVKKLVNGESVTGMAKDLNKVTLKSIKELVASGTYGADAIAELVKNAYGVQSLSAADVQRIYELNKLANETTDDYQQRKFRNQAAMILADKMPVRKLDKVRAARRIAMLLNPKTLISRNAGGNLVFGVFEDLKDAPGTLVDMATTAIAKTDWRTTSYNPFATAKAEFLGAKKGLTEWARDIKEGVDTSPTQHEMPRSTALKSKLGAGVETALYKLLALGDRPFFEAAYAKRIDELKRLGMDYASDDAVVEATAYALERVFQNDSVLAEKAMQMRDSLGILGDIALPFIQTPANIADKVLDYSPYGFVRAIKKAGTVRDSAWSQKQFVDTLARSMTGTGILTLAFALLKNGLMTGGEPDEEDEGLSYQKRATGWQPYSIWVGDKSYTYDWATPVGTLLAMGADMAQAADGEEGLFNILAAGAKAGINTMFNQSYLEGLTDLFGSDDMGANLESMFMNLPASFTPTALQQIAKIIDPIARDTYDTTGWKRAWNKIKAKTPFLSKTLPARISASGQEITNFGGSAGANVFESFLSPGYIGENTQTSVDKEASRLFEITGDSSVLPDWSEYTSKSDLGLTSNGTKYTMTMFEWTYYQKTRGQYAYEQLGKLITSSDYKRMSDADKADIVSDVLQYSREIAKRQFFNGRGVDYSSTWDKTYDAIETMKIDAVDYLQFKNAATGQKKEVVVDLIDDMRISVAQKNYLYRSYGYAESTIDETPWHR